MLHTVFQGLADAAQRLHAQYLSGWRPTSSSTTTTTSTRPRRCSRKPGLSSGFKTSLAYNAGDPVQEPIAILYQTALREIGVDLKLKKLPAGDFYENVTRAQAADDLLSSTARGARMPGYSMTSISTRSRS